MIQASFAHAVGFLALRKAALAAARGHRDGEGVAPFLADLEQRVLLLERELLAGNWQPQPLRSFRIREPKPRIVHAAAFVDRVVHHALCAELEPLFEGMADADSYACRTGKGTHAAVRRVQHHSRRYPWFVKLDIRHFFETVPHAGLLARLAPTLRDPDLRELVTRVLSVGYTTPGFGIPIGNLTSQHFGNFYLSFLDQFARRTLRVPALVRYMDDVLLFGPDKATVRDWAVRVDAFVTQKLGLSIKHEATIVAPVWVGVPYLGFRVWPRLIRLDAVRIRRLRRRLAMLARRMRNGELDEAGAQRSAGAVIAWASHADTLHLRRKIVGDRLDGFHVPGGLWA